MGIIREHTELRYGSLGTTRTVSIDTGAAQLVTITSGYTALEITNLGPIKVAYGDSSILAGSGVVLPQYSIALWEGVVGSFGVYFRADSASAVTSTIAINEYIT